MTISRATFPFLLLAFSVALPEAAFAGRAHGGSWGSGFESGADYHVDEGPYPYYPNYKTNFNKRNSGNSHVAWCLNRYRTYNPQTDTFIGKDGKRHRCYPR